MHFNALLASALIAVTAPLVFAQPSLPNVPNCAVSDIACLTTQSQFTVLGTVESNTMAIPPSNASVYNATVRFSCAFYSGIHSDATGLTSGGPYTVTGFGNPNPKCPASAPGADAVVGSTRLFFVFVANSAGQGASRIFTIFNPCGGGIEYTDTVKTTLATVLASNSTGAISGANRGADATCTALPTVSVTSTVPAATSSNGAGNPLVAPPSPATMVFPQWTMISAVMTLAIAAIGAFLV